MTLTPEQEERYGEVLWNHEIDPSEQQWSELHGFTKSLFRHRAVAVAEAVRKDMIAEIRAQLVDPEVVLDITDEMFMNGFEVSPPHDEIWLAAMAAGVLVSHLTGECAICLKSEIEGSIREDTDDTE